MKLLPCQVCGKDYEGKPYQVYDTETSYVPACKECYEKNQEYLRTVEEIAASLMPQRSNIISTFNIEDPRKVIHTFNDKKPEVVPCDQLKHTSKEGQKHHSPMKPEHSDLIAQGHNPYHKPILIAEAKLKMKCLQMAVKLQVANPHRVSPSPEDIAKVAEQFYDTIMQTKRI